MNKSALAILIADDHAVVRHGLKQIIQSEFPKAEFGEATNAAEALSAVRTRAWDLLVLDISMPDRNGIEVLSEVKQSCPDLPVLMLSFHPEEQYAVRTLRAGAAGYLPKDSPREELLEAVRTVLQGSTYVSGALAVKIATRIVDPSAIPPHEQLSRREDQIMRRLAAGEPLNRIAEELSLSIKTVSTYRHRVLVKMRMQTNADLTRYAVENGLI